MPQFVRSEKLIYILCGTTTYYIYQKCCSRHKYKVSDTTVHHMGCAYMAWEGLFFFLRDQ